MDFLNGTAIKRFPLVLAKKPPLGHEIISLPPRMHVFVKRRAIFSDGDSLYGILTLPSDPTPDT